MTATKKKRSSRKKFWAWAGAILVVLTSGLFLLRSRMQRPLESFVELEQQVVESGALRLETLSRSALESTAHSAAMDAAAGAPRTLGNDAHATATLAAIAPLTFDQFFAPVTNQFPQHMQVSPWVGGFFQWIWQHHGVEPKEFTSVPNIQNLTPSQRKALEAGIRNAISDRRKPTLQEIEFSRRLSEQKRVIYVGTKYQPEKAVEEWKEFSNRMETFLLQEPWTLPPPDRTQPVQFAVFTMYTYQSYVLDLAIARAIRRGEIERARRMYLRAVDLFRYLQLRAYPKGISLQDWGTDFELLTAGWSHAEVLGAETLAEAADIIEGARLTPEEFKALWPEFALDVHRQMIEKYEQHNKRLFVEVMGEDWRRYFFKGRPQGYVSRAIFPAARRQMERMAIGYANNDEALIQSAHERLDRICDLMNVHDPSYEIARWMGRDPDDDFAQRQRVRSGEDYNRTLDEAQIVMSFMRFRAEHRRMPRSIDELVPAYLEREVLNRGDSTWAILTVPPFRHPDLSIGVLQNSERWIPAEIATPFINELYKAYRNFRKAYERTPETSEELRPFINNSQFLELLDHVFVEFPETTVLVEINRAYLTNAFHYRVRFPVNAWPEADFEPLLD